MENASSGQKQKSNPWPYFFATFVHLLEKVVPNSFVTDFFKEKLLSSAQLLSQ